MRTETPVRSEHPRHLQDADQCSDSKVVQRHSLVPPHRRARVVLAVVFLSVSLFFLSYVSTL